MIAREPTREGDTDALLAYERRVRALAEAEPLVRRQASRYLHARPRGVLLEDLVAVGMAAVWEALVRRPADAHSGAYLKCRSRGAIVDFLRAQYRSCRESLASQADDDDAGFTASRAEAYWTVTPEALLEQSRRTEQLHACVSALPVRERRIVRSRYFEDAALNGVALELGVSGPRISQMHHRALRRLRRWLVEDPCEATHPGVS